MYERCEKLRPTLFRLASDTTDDDEALGTVSFSRVGSTHPRVWAPRGALCLPWGALPAVGLPLLPTHTLEGGS